jgi:dTDP-glucose 4,6-dehydratase
MRIFITGGCGFIGSNLVRLALGRGHEVLNFDALTYAGNRRSLADLESDRAYRFVHGDIADPEAVRRAFDDFRPEAVMHLAAESHVDRSIDGPMAFVRTNVVGSAVLLEAARTYRAGLPGGEADRFRYLHVSTDEVYGSLGPEGKFAEHTRYDPHSPYSASKAASDHLARAWHHTFGLPVIVTNCSNNYGPYQYPEKLIPVAVLKALQGEPVPVYGKGENVRDWLYVGDHADALLLAVERGEPGETYNVGGDNEWRNIDLVRALCGLLDQEAPRPDGKPYAAQIHFVADRPGHDLRYAIDSTKIQDGLGWRPTENAESGFRRTVRWYLENREWCAAVLRDGRSTLERLGRSRQPEIENLVGAAPA